MHFINSINLHQNKKKFSHISVQPFFCVTSLVIYVRGLPLPTHTNLSFTTVPAKQNEFFYLKGQLSSVT